jgi:hypothetical protein
VNVVADDAAKVHAVTAGAESDFGNGQRTFHYEMIIASAEIDDECSQAAVRHGHIVVTTAGIDRICGGRGIKDGCGGKIDEGDTVVAVAAAQRVVAAAVVNDVVAISAVDRVIVGAADEMIVSGRAIQNVFRGDDIISFAAIDYVSHLHADQHVIAVSAEDFHASPPR